MALRFLYITAGAADVRFLTFQCLFDEGAANDLKYFEMVTKSGKIPLDFESQVYGTEPQI